MATTLYLRNLQSNIANTSIGNQYFFMTTARGASVTGADVDTVSGGTEIQWTDISGGTQIAWISQPVNSTQNITASTCTYNIWALESKNTGNAGGRSRLFRWSANNGTETLIAGPTDDGVEFNTTIGAFNWTNTATATTLLKGDRIIVKYYIAGVGTMGSGQTCTMGYNGGSAGANGDSYVTLTDNLTFQRRIYVSP